MPNNLIVIPLAFQIVAIIFSPLGLATNSACSVSPFNNPACGVIFSTNATIAFTPSGYSYNVGAASQSCQSVNVGGTSIAQVPILGTLTQLPVLGNVADFFIWLGQNAIHSTGINPNSTPNSACITAATQSIMTFSYTGSDIILLFIGAVAASAGITVIASITIFGNGVNAGGAFVIFTISSLTLIYLIVTSLAYPTWATIPSPYGSGLYSLLTLMFAIGMIEETQSIRG